jgi:hypothetical protein
MGFLGKLFGKSLELAAGDDRDAFIQKLGRSEIQESRSDPRGERRAIGPARTDLRRVRHERRRPGRGRPF